MTLDLDEQTIKYKINDTDYKAVKMESLSKDIEYRLAVTLADKGNEIELL